VANADIFRNLADACDRWVAGAIQPEDLGPALAGHLGALEGPGSWPDSTAVPARVYAAWWGPDPAHGPIPADRAALGRIVAELRAWPDASPTRLWRIRP
jgi:hypothetical protein